MYTDETLDTRLLRGPKTQQFWLIGTPVPPHSTNVDKPKKKRNGKSVLAVKSQKKPEISTRHPGQRFSSRDGWMVPTFKRVDLAGSRNPLFSVQIFGTWPKASHHNTRNGSGMSYLIDQRLRGRGGSSPRFLRTHTPFRRRQRQSLKVQRQHRRPSSNPSLAPPRPHPAGLSSFSDPRLALEAPVGEKLSFSQFPPFFFQPFKSKIG